jgi:trigger factor
VSHKSEHYIEDYNEQLLDLAVADATIKFPPQMLEEEISNLIEQMKSRLSYQGLNWDAYLNTRGIDEESIRAESSEAAEKRLKKNLVLFQIADEEDIQVEPDEIQDTVNQTLKMYIDVLGESETQKLLNSQEQLQNMTNNILSQKIVSKTLALLKAIATGEELEEEIQTEEASGDSAETSEATEPVAEETEEPEKEE